jgi:FixJ family two-component response regulator
MIKESQITQSLSSKDKGPRHVFLIDDNDELRRDLINILEYVGFIVHPFKDPVEFLAYNKQLIPAVIVTDMRMPNMSGGELQEKLSELGRMVPMVFISGESTDRQIISALKGGAIDFLLKPFSREDLLAAVSRGIEVDSINMRMVIRKAEFEAKLESLSPRERQVFDLLAKGYMNAELIEVLNIALPTAKQYKSQVMYKLRLRTLSELIELHQIYK